MTIQSCTRSALALFGLATAALAGPACALPECARPSYDEAECRVIAENEHARLLTAEGVEVRFLPAGARRMDPWDATGLVAAREDGSVDARVAGLGNFTLAVERASDGPESVTVHLSNLDSAAAITLGPRDAPIRLPITAAGQTTRTLEVALPDADPVFIEGTRSCPDRYRIAVMSDIQTNPDQFKRIVEVLRDEWDDANLTGQPLVGLVVPGDVTESSRDEEFALVHEILRGLPFPVAVTPGNHDIFRPGRPHFTRNFGPGNHTFSVCRTHVALLDSGSGAIAPSVEARLPELLDRGEADFSVVGMHHPPYAGWTGSGWSREDQAARLLVEAAIADVDLIVAGHSHSLVDFPDIPVGNTTLREIIAGTAGANQGVGVPRYGYVRLTFGETVAACFVEVPPPGYAEPPNPAPRLGRCP
ncbi:MAG: metallophosphoesterase [Myxococcota bacterium]